MGKHSSRIRKTPAWHAGQAAAAALKKLRPRKAKPALVATIGRVISRKAETKVAMYFGNNTTSASAVYPSVWAVQNQFIKSNNTDILPVIPYISQGTSDNQRTGKSISPKSFKIHCSVSLNPLFVTGLNSQANNIVAVAYLLQHKQLKSMQLLKFVATATSGVTGNNDFTQLLDPANNNTQAFIGNESDSRLPVSSQFYKVLGKKVIPLRNDFYGSTSTMGVSLTGNSQPQQLYHKWTWNATKHLPKSLEYVEQSTTMDNNILNLPTNSSMFWCIGYYNMNVDGSATPVTLIQQQYQTELRYKDF